MHTPIFDLPAPVAKKVTLPHVTMLNGPRPKPPMPSLEACRETPAPAVATLILVGLDDKGKPHASWFEEDQADAAAVAADLMGFAIIDISNDELAAIASGLPKGKLFDSGKAFVPFVKRTVYDQLAAHLDEDYLNAAAARVEAAQAAASESYAAASKGDVPHRKPEDWSKLAAGDLVLALDEPDDAWFVAVVIEPVAGDKFRLRWRDYADQPTITRSILEIALLHPQSPDL